MLAAQTLADTESIKVHQWEIYGLTGKENWKPSLLVHLAKIASCSWLRNKHARWTSKNLKTFNPNPKEAGAGVGWRSLWEVKASIMFILSSKTVRATWRDCLKQTTSSPKAQQHKPPNINNNNTLRKRILQLCSVFFVFFLSRAMMCILTDVVNPFI